VCKVDRSVCCQGHRLNEYLPSPPRSKVRNRVLIFVSITLYWQYE
jgi:hypothetical protein